MRLLRILRLDDSDAEIYLPAAKAGEFAVPGTFMFTFDDVPPERLGGSEAEAFRRGFLGLESLGWGTLVTIAEASEADRRAAIERMTSIFIDRFGAPDQASAEAQAEEELAFVDELCQRSVNTILSLERSIGPDGDVEEQFHTHEQQADWSGQFPVVRLIPEDEE